MTALLAQVPLVILCYITTAVTIKIDDVNLCKRQPFRGRCPTVKGKGPIRSQFVLRYYLRDNECVSYPFGHCADDENEPMLYRYKDECEKACLNKWPNSGTTTENSNTIRKSTIALGSKITANDTDTDKTDKHVDTITESFTANDTTMLSKRIAFADQKNAPHKLLTECERSRQASESGLSKSDFIPICTADGSYRPLQCEKQRKNCFCVDHNGIKIPNSDSNSAKKPDCKRIIKAQKSLIYECLSAVDSGPCNTAIKRWYYDKRERQCIQFEYSGCGGNGNNYPTKALCEKQCKSTSNEPKCKDGLEPLKNENGHLVNCSESACPDGYLCSVAQLGSACCPINASRNVGSNICQLPKERGPCDQYELRFYYNNRLGECKYFFYGGCEGNANNFERVEECERICRQREVKLTATSIVSAPQLITSGPQMRKLNKEFGAKNSKKTSEENELIELTDNAASANNEYNTNSVSNATGNIANDDTTSEANLETKETSTSSSVAIFRDHSTISKDLSSTSTTATSTDQSKLQLSQKIDQNIHKKIKQKGTMTSLDSSNTDKVIDFTTVKPENTTATFDNLEKFVVSDDESYRNEQKFSSKSITTTGQQLSSSGKQITISTSTSMTTEERSSDTSRSLPISTTLVTVPLRDVITSQLITSPTMKSIVPQLTENMVDQCFQKLDRGTCTGQFIRWYWDSEKNTCQVFTYSGCGGNGNNFRSREDCFAACHQSPQPIINVDNVCEHTIHPGDCTGVFERFAFDSTINDCRPFTYTGCGGNGNNFGSSLECRNRCIMQRPTLSTDVCQHPIEVGECSGVFPRFAYDLVANECRPFTYGGCGGNGNNFGSIIECKKTCVRGQPDVSMRCPTVDISLCVEPCILFTNRRGCHECTCPMVQPKKVENALIESSTSSPSISDTSTDEPKLFEADQFLQNQVDKKNEPTSSHPERISQTNSVIELGEKCTQPMV
uniref:Papilin n=1 Tax=Loa loa TaxID=7209 RepID=A0A1I7W4I1_LOALO